MIVGAAGDVGRGIVSAALASGRQVVACGRTLASLEELAREHASERLACVAGSLASEEEAARLWRSAQEPFGAIGDAVVSVNAPGQVKPIIEWSAQELSASLSGNLTSHLIAARAFIPNLPADGVFIGIGGGTADFIIPGMAHFSIAQAGLRMLYKGLGKECRDGPAVRELMVVSMVSGRSNRDAAKPEWITDEEIGKHVCTVLDSPEKFPGAILKLQSKEQVGEPEVRN